MIGCLRTRIPKQPITVLYFESEAWMLVYIMLSPDIKTVILRLVTQGQRTLFSGLGHKRLCFRTCLGRLRLGNPMQHFEGCEAQSVTFISNNASMFSGQVMGNMKTCKLSIR